jgi:hypothetical protein
MNFLGRKGQEAKCTFKVWGQHIKGPEMAYMEGTFWLCVVDITVKICCSMEHTLSIKSPYQCLWRSHREAEAPLTNREALIGLVLAGDLRAPCAILSQRQKHTKVLLAPHSPHILYTWTPLLFQAPCLHP